MKNFFVILNILLSIHAYGQTKPKLDIDILFGADKYMASFTDDAYVPEDIAKKRKFTSPYNHDSKTHTDIPQYHYSAYAALVSTLEIKKKLNIHFDIFGEQRGASFGTLIKENYLLYPNIYCDYIDSIQISSKTLKVNVWGGDMYNYKHHNGLKLNNYNAQGISISTSMNKWTISYIDIADAQIHTGLNIGEIYAPEVSYKHLTKNGKTIIGSLALDIYKAQFVRNDKSKMNYLPTFNLNIKKNKTTIYTESSFRIPQSRLVNKDHQNQIAMIIGFETEKIKIQKSNFYFTAKIRYYGKYFNNNFVSYGIKYRNPRLPLKGYNNTGSALYPLISYQEDFDRWSIYTEYHNSRIFSLATKTKYQKHLFNNFWINFENENNLMAIEENENPLYTFYYLSIRKKMPHDFDFEIFTTNKLMNLDIHYQSFYQAKVPIIGFSFHRIIGKYKINNF